MINQIDIFKKKKTRDESYKKSRSDGTRLRRIMYPEETRRLMSKLGSRPKTVSAATMKANKENAKKGGQAYSRKCKERAERQRQAELTPSPMPISPEEASVFISKEEDV